MCIDLLLKQLSSLDNHNKETVQTDETATDLMTLAPASFLQDLQTFYFDVFQFSKTVGRERQMRIMAIGLLSVNNIQVDEARFLNFVSAIQGRYMTQVAYHNDLHASDCAQHVSFLLNQ